LNPNSNQLIKTTARGNTLYNSTVDTKALVTSSPGHFYGSLLCYFSLWISILLFSCRSFCVCKLQLTLFNQIDWWFNPLRD